MKRNVFKHKIPCVVDDFESDVLRGMTDRLHEVMILREEEDFYVRGASKLDVLARDLGNIYKKTIVIHGGMPSMSWAVLPDNWVSLKEMTLNIMQGTPKIYSINGQIMISTDMAEFLLRKAKN